MTFPPVFAIDPSQTGFAWSAMWWHDLNGAVRLREDHAEHATKSPGKGASPRARVARAGKITSRLDAVMYATGGPLEGRANHEGLCLIEGYSHNSRQGAHFLGEFGGLVRSWLLDSWMGAVVEVAPKQLKKFAAGKGNASKALVTSALSKRYDREFATDNAADAFGLLMLGLCVVGAREPETKAQREVVDLVTAAYDAELAHLIESAPVPIPATVAQQLGPVPSPKMDARAAAPAGQEHTR